MSNMINVDGSDDPAYRYKMPRLLSKVEGRGNGVKTVLVNCSEVAASLHRSTGQVCKFFGCELGAMTNYEEKFDKALVNGSFETKVLQEALTGYIQKFVLCPSCGNPETVQESRGKKKSAIIFLNCKACGASEEADNTHRLVTFIIKELSSEGGSKSKKELRRLKRIERNRRKEKGEDVESEKEEISKSSKEKKKKKKKDKDKDGKKKKKKRDKDGKRKEKKEKKEKNIAQDISPETSDVEEKVEEASEELGALTVHDIAALDNAVERVSQHMQNEESPQSVMALVEDLQLKSGLRRAERVPIFIYALQATSLVSQRYGLYSICLSKIIAQVSDCYLTTEDLEIDFLLSMEEAIARQQDEEQKTKMVKMIPFVVKCLYDEEVVSEEVLLNWFQGTLDSGKFNHVRCIVSDSDVAAIKLHAKPIISWLEEADTDTDSDEEDE